MPFSSFPLFNKYKYVFVRNLHKYVEIITATFTLLPLSLKDSDCVMRQVYLYKLGIRFAYQETTFIYISYTKLLLRFAKMAIGISIALQP